MSAASASADVAALEDAPPADALKGLPEVQVHETADETRFDCPPAWFLVLNSIGMSAMTAVTVIGAFFFVLAANTQLTNYCWLWQSKFTQVACTASTVAFWTYPTVCCVFVFIIFAKNMVDARMYYEFLLHRVFVGYERRSILTIFNFPALPLLLLYAMVAMTSMIWHMRGHALQVNAVQEMVYAYMAYLMPVVSFVATLVTKWSVNYSVIPVCEFLEDFEWGRELIDGSQCYSLATVEMGYIGLEHALTKEHGTMDTPRLVALVAHYAKEYQEHREADIPVSKTQKVLEVVRQGGDLVHTAVKRPGEAVEKITEKLERAQERVKSSLFKPARSIIYWPVRMLFNKHLSDARSKEFRFCSVAYIGVVVLVIFWGIRLYFQCVVTGLQVEHVLVRSEGWLSRMLIDHFSLLVGHVAKAPEEVVGQAFEMPTHGHLRTHVQVLLAAGN